MKNRKGQELERRLLECNNQIGDLKSENRKFYAITCGPLAISTAGFAASFYLPENIGSYVMMASAVASVPSGLWGLVNLFADGYQVHRNDEWIDEIKIKKEEIQQEIERYKGRM